MPSLYHLNEALLGALQTLADNGGELTPELESILAFDEANFEQKAESYCHILADLKGKIAGVKAEIDRLEDLLAGYDAKSLLLKTRLRDAVALRGGKAQAGTFALRVQANGGKTPVQLDATLNPETLPDDLRVVKYSPNVDAIRAKLEAGESLHFATLGERGTHLRGV